MNDQDTKIKQRVSSIRQEYRVKQKVTKILDYFGAYHFPPATYGYGRSGIPDIVACYKGVFIGIECKSGTNKPTKLQMKELERIKQVGGISLVINEENLDSLIQVLNRL